MDIGGEIDGGQTGGLPDGDSDGAEVLGGDPGGTSDHERVGTGVLHPLGDHLGALYVELGGIGVQESEVYGSFSELILEVFFHVNHIATPRMNEIRATNIATLASFSDLWGSLKTSTAQ